MINIEKFREDLEDIIGGESNYETYMETVEQVIKYLAGEGMGFAEDGGLPEVEENHPFIRLDEQANVFNAGFKKFIPLKDLIDG